MKFKAIVFDLGKVLVQLDLPNFAKHMISKSNITLTQEEFIEEYIKISEPYHLGKISNNNFYTLIKNHFQLERLNQTEFFTIFNNILLPGIIPETTKLLEKLYKLRKYKILCLSNTNSIHMEYGAKKWDFLMYFDDIILSYEVQAMKPESKIYEITIEKAGCQPEEMIFIDDSVENVKAAEQYGIKAILFNNFDELQLELRNLKVI